MQRTLSAYHQVSLSTLRFVRHADEGFSFMDILWQHNSPANPADAAIGPQSYDHHLYYRFGQVSLSITAT